MSGDYYGHYYYGVDDGSAAAAAADANPRVRRKRSRSNDTRFTHDSQPLDNNNVSFELKLMGVKCPLHRNDSIAKQIEQGKHLMILHRGHSHHHDKNLGHWENEPPTDGINGVSGGEYPQSSFSLEDATSMGGNRDYYDEGNDTWEDIVHPLSDSTSTDVFVKESSSAETTKKKKNVDDTIIYVDRYDVRTLLSDDFDIHQDDAAIIDSSNNETDYPWDDDLTVEQRQILAMDRFGDLSMSTEESSNEILTTRNKLETLKEDENEPCVRCVTDQGDLPYFSDNRTPHGMVIPKTQRMYQIMKITATKSQESPQFEVLLKVKQQDNVDFEFLNCNHELYPFYQWLKHDNHHGAENGPKLSEESQSKRQKNHPSMQLLEMYASSSSSDDESSVAHSKPNSCSKSMDSQVVATVAAAAKDTVAQEMSSQDAIPPRQQSIEEKRQRRLQRAKMLRHHFATS